MHVTCFSLFSFFIFKFHSNSDYAHEDHTGKTSDFENTFYKLKSGSDFFLLRRKLI